MAWISYNSVHKGKAVRQGLNNYVPLQPQTSPNPQASHTGSPVAQALIEPDDAPDTRTQREPDTLMLSAHDGFALILEPRDDAAVADHLAARLDEPRETVALDLPLELAHRGDEGRGDRRALVGEHARGVHPVLARCGAAPERGLDDVPRVCALQPEGHLVLRDHLRGGRSAGARDEGMVRRTCCE